MGSSTQLASDRVGTQLKCELRREVQIMEETAFDMAKNVKKNNIVNGVRGGHELAN